MFKSLIILFVFFSTGILMFENTTLLSQEFVQNKQNQDQAFKNRTYKEGIKTVLIHKKGWELSFPIINLNNEEEKIMLSFDELGDDINEYSWQIIHCNTDWTQSELEPIDYLTNFFEGEIYNYNLSKNTTIDYINYSIDFPNDDVGFQKSGNYIVKVFEQNDPRQIVLTRKFYIIDRKVKLTGSIFKQSLLNSSNNQRVNFEINYDNDIWDAYSNLTTIIIKNGGSGISTQNIAPSQISTNKIDFKNINKLSFPGGNEFRHFDIKSLKFLSDNLEKINYNNIYTVDLRVSEPRALETYNFKNDLNGQSLIKLENSNQSNIKADYCEVTFRLKTPLNLNKGDYYVFGALSDWQTHEDYKMSFDINKQEYTLSLLLKQGYYNYKYIFKSEGLVIDETSQWYSIEGNKYQTENDYYLLSYYKNPSEQSEELVGFIKINSNSTP